jgi:integrase
MSETKTQTITKELSTTLVKRYLKDPDVDRINAKGLNLELRYLRNGQASWYVKYFRNSKSNWTWIGRWPGFSVEGVLSHYDSIVGQLVKGEPICTNNWDMVFGLFDWYLDRQLSLSDKFLPKTVKRDIKSAINCHLLPMLGEVKIKDLNTSVIDELFYLPLAVEGGLSISSINQHFLLLKRAFASAKSKHLITFNPIEDITFKTFYPHEIDSKPGALFAHDLPCLLKALNDCTNKNAVMYGQLLLHMGTRKSETLSLCWDYFNFELMSLTIPGVRSGGVRNTKTGDDLEIAITAQLNTLLSNWRQKQIQRGYKGDHVFPSPVKGKSWVSGTTGDNWIKALVAASGINFATHDFRKIFTDTIFKSLHVDSLVANLMLNHRINKMTATYIHNEYMARKRLALEQYHNHLTAITETKTPIATETVPRQPKSLSIDEHIARAA